MYTLFVIAKEINTSATKEEIDFGKQLYETSSQSFNQSDEIKKKCIGRLISLESIRRRHLQLMADLGFLRNTYVRKMSVETCQEELLKRKGKTKPEIVSLK